MNGGKKDLISAHMSALPGESEIQIQERDQTRFAHLLKTEFMRGPFDFQHVHINKGEDPMGLPLCRFECL
jgi:hypothetical protein